MLIRPSKCFLPLVPSIKYWIAAGPLSGRDGTNMRSFPHKASCGCLARACFDECFLMCFFTLQSSILLYVGRCEVISYAPAITLLLSATLQFQIRPINPSVAYCMLPPGILSKRAPVFSPCRTTLNCDSPSKNCLALYTEH